MAKHEDGFCWWQTVTTDYSIKSARWKDGKGAISDQAKQAAYNDYYCTQLSELCTNYGPIVEIWFDGALNPGLRTRVEDILLKYQPHACTFQGPVNSVHWVGNEGGNPPMPVWNAISQAAFQRMEAGRGYPISRAGAPDGVFWMPNEVDTTLSTEWFGGHIRPLGDLLRCYYNSVGNSAQLLMNVSPRADGSMAPDNVQRAAELGAAIQAAVSAIPWRPPTAPGQR